MKGSNSEFASVVATDSKDFLGDLADPLKFTEKIQLGSPVTEKAELIKQLRLMMLIRAAEEKIGDEVTAKRIVCPCHLAIGQEAIAVGVAAALRASDRAFGTHRSHSHFLAMGGEVFELFSEVLGKEAGCSKGMGGSMHLYDEKHGFKGSVPIVAGTVSLAVGAALAAELDFGRGIKASAHSSGRDVGVAFFGDGAVEEGTVHESLNLAAHFRLPMIFVCENNLFSSHLHIGLRQPADSTARFARVHQMRTAVVDGNDVVAVKAAAEALVASARAGQGPGYLEAVTYRHRGHVGPRDDDDVGLKRSEDLSLWKKRDPVVRLQQALVDAGAINNAELAELRSGVKHLIEEAWMKAWEAPYPPLRNLMDFVYAQAQVEPLDDPSVQRDADAKRGQGER